MGDETRFTLYILICTYFLSERGEALVHCISVHIGFSGLQAPFLFENLA